ncbi:MAG TPA: hypothetical protein DIV86_03105 [Alphaproteobacteria bacterium]|nr:hypothetical protein [Alphaproteobacteria bacterium]
MRFIIKISGADAYKFLQGMVSNDVGKLSDASLRGADARKQSILTSENPSPIDCFAGARNDEMDKAIHAYLLTPQGKYLFDFFIVKKSDAFYLIVLPTEKFPELLKRLKMYKLRSDVVIEDVSSQFFEMSLRGADATKQSILMSEASGSIDCFAVGRNDALIAFTDPRVENFCIHVLVEKNLQSPISAPLTPQQYKKLRIDNLIPEGDDFEYEGTYILQYRAIETNSVDFKKGCYVGQEVTARMYHKTSVRKTLYKVEADENLESHSGKEIMQDELVVGKLLSASSRKALAFLSVDAAGEGSQLTCGGVKLKAVLSSSQ